jgi:hypothetical protein
LTLAIVGNLWLAGFELLVSDTLTFYRESLSASHSFT